MPALTEPENPLRRLTPERLEALARELDELPLPAVERVRAVLPRCGVDPEPVPVADLVALGLLD